MRMDGQGWPRVAGLITIKMCVKLTLVFYCSRVKFLIYSNNSVAAKATLVSGFFLIHREVIYGRT